MRSGIVSVSWLAEQLRTPGSIRVVDATWFLPNSPFAAPEPFANGREAFEAGPRIGGARFWDIDEYSDPDAAPDTPHNLPTAAQFATAAARCGIRGCEDKVVLYDQVGTFSSPRLWYTLRSFGFEDVAVLDGGLPAWVGARARKARDRLAFRRRLRISLESQSCPTLRGFISSSMYESGIPSG